MLQLFIKSFGLLVVLCVSASSLHAQTLGAPTVPGFTGNGPSTAPTIVKGRADASTVTCPSALSISNTQCTDATTYAGNNQCLTGVCGCIKWNCTERNAFAGNGTATLEINIDVGNAAAGTPPDCYPIVGDFVTTSTDPETINFNGAICDPVTTKSTTAPLSGGWQLEAFGTSKITDGAGGSFTGTVSLSTGELKLTLKGTTF
jgi:hypothetical protein